MTQASSPGAGSSDLLSVGRLSRAVLFPAGRLGRAVLRANRFLTMHYRRRAGRSTTRPVSVLKRSTVAVHVMRAATDQARTPRTEHTRNSTAQLVCSHWL